MKHEHCFLRSSSQKNIFFLNPLAVLDHTAVKTALYLFFIFLFKKGGVFLCALPFKHSWWFYFQLKIVKLVTDVLILLTETEGNFFYCILNKVL